ncbi:MAG: ECF-type sigma factor [Planctomycetota bacterium]
MSADVPATTSGGGESDSVGFDTLYRRLRSICGRRLSAESIDHTLQATALANEVWLRLHELDPAAAANPGKSTRWFVANAVVAIRQVLIDMRGAGCA